MVVVFVPLNTQDGGVRSSQETASSRCHACRQIESSSNCSFLAFHCPLIKTCHLTHIKNYSRCKMKNRCYGKVIDDCCKNMYLKYACLSLSQQSEQKVTLPPPTVGMCAILADQVLTQRKKPRPMTHFDPLLTPSIK